MPMRCWMALAELAGGWPERVLVQQRNWIGKSQGARVRFAVAQDERTCAMEVFTTRVDTIYGVSAVLISANHPALDEIARRHTRQSQGWRSKSRPCAQKSVRAADIATAEKEGFFTGRFALNPFSGESRADLGGEFCARGIRNRRGDVRSGARPARFRICGEISICQ